MELWREIPGFDLYEISTYGNIRRKKTGRMIKPALHWQGYTQVSLRKNKRSHTKKVHALMRDAFFPPTIFNLQINHKDGIKSNNKLRNLELTTGSYNCLHSSKILGEHHSTKKRAVEMIDIKTGEVLQTFATTVDAGKYVNGRPQFICYCCKGVKKNFHGYEWKYADAA